MYLHYNTHLIYKNDCIFNTKLQFSAVCKGLHYLGMCFLCFIFPTFKMSDMKPKNQI